MLDASPPVWWLGKRTTCAAQAAKTSRRDGEEVVVGRIVGPQREHPARLEVFGHPPQPRRRVEGGVAAVQQVARRVVDVDEHGVEPRRRLGPEPEAVGDQGEEVAVHEATARVVDEHVGVRHQAPLVPLDHVGQRLDDVQGPHPRVLEHRGAP